MLLSQLSQRTGKTMSGVPRRPAMRWDVRYSTAGHSFSCSHDSEEYEFEGIAPDEAGRVAAAIDGDRSVSEIASYSNVAPSRVAAVVGALVHAGLAVDLDGIGQGDLSGEEFARLCRGLYPDWKLRLFSHDLWTGLAMGTASRSVFKGWLLESYHFIEGANDRMPLAVAECPAAGLREVLAHHYVEEWDHGGFFMSSLNAYGVSADVVHAARPLPSTRQVLNYMRRCARLGPLYYAACSGFLESTGTDRAGARDFYERLTRHYAADRPHVIKPMADHTDLDEAYGHGEMLELMAARMEPVSLPEASRIIGAAYEFMELLELWSQDILQTYSRPGAGVRVEVEFYRPATAVHGNSH